MTTRRHIRVVGAMLEKGSGHYLITQRSKTASLPLLWEFPGGRVQDGETDEAALKREMKERLHLDISVQGKAATTHHEYAEYDLDFSVFHCTLVDPNATVTSPKINDHRWVQLADMGQ